MLANSPNWEEGGLTRENPVDTANPIPAKYPLTNSAGLRGERSSTPSGSLSPGSRWPSAPLTPGIQSGANLASVSWRKEVAPRSPPPMVLESPAGSWPYILCRAEAGPVLIPRLCSLSTGSTETQPGDAGWTGLHGASRPPHRAEGPCEVALHSPARPASGQGGTCQERSPVDCGGNQCCRG